MKELEVKDNPTGLHVFINGIPDIKLIPKDVADCIISALETQISELYKKKGTGFQNTQNEFLTLTADHYEKADSVFGAK